MVQQSVQPTVHEVPSISPVTQPSNISLQSAPNKRVNATPAKAVPAKIPRTAPANSSATSPQNMALSSMNLEMFNRLSLVEKSMFINQLVYNGLITPEIAEKARQTFQQPSRSSAKKR
jgi:hypothetical protein